MERYEVFEVVNALLEQFGNASRAVLEKIMGKPDEAKVTLCKEKEREPVACLYAVYNLDKHPGLKEVVERLLRLLALQGREPSELHIYLLPSYRELSAAVKTIKNADELKPCGYKLGENALIVDLCEVDGGYFKKRAEMQIVVKYREEITISPEDRIRAALKWLA